ncbi:hypothetical protein [Leisingera caerulea]|uniref:hypothetical protein n=1 Tax=Leisingera caerulea TaxID=506591 RepID=UPI000685177F|nr:hypothetical protein [Leisingera caerulea]
MFKKLFFILFSFAAQAAAEPHVVHSDRGGSLAARLEEISRIKAAGEPVEIRGRVCFSTCTMFLGVPGTCVSPKTIFGFHGPSRGGRRLSRKNFDYFSRVMASYYPGRLADWFLKSGRFRIHGVYKIQGSELIRQGLAKACR